MTPTEAAAFLGMSVTSVKRLDRVLRPYRLRTGERVYGTARLLAFLLKRERARLGDAACTHVTPGREIKASSCSLCLGIPATRVGAVGTAPDDGAPEAGAPMRITGATPAAGWR